MYHYHSRTNILFGDNSIHYIERLRKDNNIDLALPDRNGFFQMLPLVHMPDNIALHPYYHVAISDFHCNHSSNFPLSIVYTDHTSQYMTSSLQILSLSFPAQ